MAQPQGGAKRSMIKVPVIGDSGVGKTNLLNCYVLNKFDPRFKSTVGSDFLSKDLTIDGEPVVAALWDTAGQERFQSLGTAYLRGSDGCVVVFDVTNQDSFEHLSSWMEEFEGQCGKKPIVLMANKCDKDLDPSKRAITTATAKRWCQQNGDVTMFETSARDAVNVDAAFEFIAQAALRARKASAEDMKMPDPKRVKNIAAPSQVKEEKGCPC
jgi:Ras-related protein Rab-7A